MNIIVRIAEGKYIVRPDTTWERDNEDIYVPEFVNRLSWTPVLFARISKPGRSVGEEFAERYYDGIGYGVLLYPEDMCDGSEAGFACANCLDHTSFLPFPVYNKVTLDRPGNVFDLRLNDSAVIFSHSCASSQAIRNAIAEATRYIYIRTGDIIAIELQARKPLCARDTVGDSAAFGDFIPCSRANLKATFCENETIDFDIIF